MRPALVAQNLYPKGRLRVLLERTMELVGLDSRRWWQVGCVVPWLLCGCMFNQRMLKVQEWFERDYNCSEATVVETDSSMGPIRRSEQTTYEVHGCGMEAVYECERDRCTVSTPADQVGPSPPKSASNPPDRPSTPLSSDIRMETQRGKATLLLDVRLDRSSLLRLTAIPDNRDD